MQKSVFNLSSEFWEGHGFCAVLSKSLKISWPKWGEGSDHKHTNIVRYTLPSAQFEWSRQWDKLSHQYYIVSKTGFQFPGLSQRGEKEHEPLKELIGNILWLNTLEVPHILRFLFSNHPNDKERWEGTGIWKRRRKIKKTGWSRFWGIKGLNVLLFCCPFNCSKDIWQGWGDSWIWLRSLHLFSLWLCPFYLPQLHYQDGKVRRKKTAPRTTLNGT